MTSASTEFHTKLTYVCCFPMHVVFVIVIREGWTGVGDKCNENCRNTLLAKCDCSDEIDHSNEPREEEE